MMPGINKISVWIVLTILFGITVPLRAQGDFGEGSKLNTNLGFTLTSPLNPTARFVNFGLGVTAGAGYNFSEHHAFVGELMWNRLSPTAQVLHPIRIALKDPGINGHADVVALTGNYRLEFRNKAGIYFIMGGGLYYRNASISRSVVTGTGTSCTPEWLWWGFQCESGLVSTDQTLASTSSTGYGANGGIGFTFGWGDPPYRFYMEARYHYAPGTNVDLQLIPITFGVRF